VELSPEERALLSALVGELGYLGRSESWVEGEVTQEPGEDFDVVPDDHGTPAGLGWEQVALLSPVPAEEYAAWRARAVEEAAQSGSRTSSKGKGSRKGRSTKAGDVEATHPKDLLACLQADTAWLQSV